MPKLSYSDAYDLWQRERTMRDYPETSDYAMPSPDYSLPSALDRQVGGTHYKDMPIQPLEFFHRNNVGPIEAVAIRYILRWRNKNGVQDIDKAIHTLQILRELALKETD